jgi:hypothetical protein
MVLLDVENRHGSSVLRVPAGESPPEEYALQRGMVTPMLRRRRRLRRAERLARAFAELDDVARERRHVPPRRTLRAALGGSR